MKKLFILLGVALATQSCVKQPEAIFYVLHGPIYTGDAVNFSNSSKDAVSYKWDFGDGTTSSEVNPTHVYDYSGNYTVKLTAYSKKNKKTSTETKTINVEKGNEIYDATNDIHYKISKVYVLDYGYYLYGTYKFDVIFATEGISYAPGVGTTGTGIYIRLEMFSTNSMDIDNGCYNYSSEHLSKTFDGYLSSPDTPTLDEDLTGGSICVNGGIYLNMKFNATKDNDFNYYLLTSNRKLHVYYSGLVTYYDMSSKSKTSKLLSKK